MKNRQIYGKKVDNLLPRAGEMESRVITKQHRASFQGDDSSVIDTAVVVQCCEYTKAP